MKRLPIESSMLKSVGYDEGVNTLEVEFTNGALYAYSDIPKEKYEKLLKAKSKGAYFSKHIRNGTSTRLSQ